MKQAIFSLNANKNENEANADTTKQHQSTTQNKTVAQVQQQACFSLETREQQSKNIKINNPIKKTENIYYFS